jgi:phage terminase large subunit
LSSSIQLPEAFRFLFADIADDGLPVRYRASFGGRGSAKSHSFAQALVIKAAQRPLRIGCFREVQLSIKDSVKRLLDDKIEAAGLTGFYESLENEIRGRNGSSFVFRGLRAMNADAIKSLEGLDIAWVEEASTVSQRSLDILRPTIRKPQSELWFTWNPEKPTDPIDAFLRGGILPGGSIIREVNYDANPWFGDSPLLAEMEHDKRRDPDKYQHVWGGGYRRMSEAAVFKNWKVEDFATPDDVIFRYGADWGFSVDPAVLVRGFVIGRTLYVDHEAYKVGCEIDETPSLFAGDKPPSYKPPPGLTWINTHKHPGVPGAYQWMITADSARPETVSYMRRQGFKIRSAIKGQGSLEDGVEFLKSYDIVVHPRCRHVADELASYSYKVDRLTSEILPVLEDKKNHTIDALRYALEALRKAVKTGTPEVVEEPQDHYAKARQRGERADGFY